MSRPASIRKPSVRRVLTLLVAVPALLVTVLVAVASAHGSTIDPPSRHYGCWKRWGNDFQNPRMATEDPMCWQAWQADVNAMWNWNGLYREQVAGNHQAALPDGQLCSGGRTASGRYAAMDQPGQWQAVNLSNNFTVKVHDAARHGADYYRIYVTKQGFDPVTQWLGWSNLELVAQTGVIPPGQGETSSEPGLNGVTVSIPAGAPGRTGRHIVFMIWQASHFDQSFYACSDVVFGGGNPNPTPTVTVTPTPTQTVTPPTPRCSAAVKLTNSWSGGFQGEATITNTGTVPIGNWFVQWTLPAGATLTQAWNGTHMQNGTTAMIHAASWNSTLQPGASATAGFQGSAGSAPSFTNVSCG